MKVVGNMTAGNHLAAIFFSHKVDSHFCEIENKKIKKKRRKQRQNKNRAKNPTNRRIFCYSTPPSIVCTYRYNTFKMYLNIMATDVFGWLKTTHISLSV